MSGLVEADGVEDWRVLDGGVSAWFDAPSLTAGAALVGRVADVVEEGGASMPDVDLRATGVRVRLGGGAGGSEADDATLANAISASAADLGLPADPSALQRVRVVIASADRPSVSTFWRTALAYAPAGEDGVADPSRRDPAIAFEELDEPRPLRNRIHADVVRPPDAVEAVKEALGREASGPFGVMIADDDGNEIDLVPGDDLPGGADTADWRAVFSAMAFYPTASARQAAELAAAVAGLADSAGVSLLVDLRSDGVTIDSGKDQWVDDVQPDFPALAADVQRAARDLGLTADPTPLRFVQFGIDAVDIPAARAFWTAALGYEHDPRQHLTDIYDPRRETPVLFFQDLDASDEARLRQRNRIRFELVVPRDHAQARVDAALAAGGRLLAEATGRWTIADPGDNELVVVASR